MPVEYMVVVMVMVAGHPAPALLVRVMMLPVMVGVRVAASLVLRVRAAVRRLRPEHILPQVVQRIEEAPLVEKPQEHCNCG